MADDTRREKPVASAIFERPRTGASGGASGEGNDPGRGSHSSSAASIQDLITALTTAADIADRLGAVDTAIELRALIADAEDNQDA